MLTWYTSCFVLTFAPLPVIHVPPFHLFFNHFSDHTLLQFRPVLVGEISTSGNFAAVFLHQFGKAWRVKLNAQVGLSNHRFGCQGRGGGVRQKAFLYTGKGVTLCTNIWTCWYMYSNIY